MKIPNKINILSDIYTIQIKPDVFLNNDNKALQGEIKYKEKIITLSRLDNSSMVKTLLHEIIHGICMDLKLFDDGHDEAFIDRLAAGLADTLIRNNMLKG